MFKDLLDEGVLQSVSHVYPLEVAKFIGRLTAALEDIALAMELRGKNFFTLAELDAICNDPAMSLLVRNTGRILFGEADPNGGVSYTITCRNTWRHVCWHASPTS